MLLFQGVRPFAALYAALLCTVISSENISDLAPELGWTTANEFHVRHTKPISFIEFQFTTGKPLITVKDNHKPAFTECTKYAPSVKEEEPVGTYVFTVHATDPDPIDMGGKVTYKFISTPGDKERFHVDPTTGRITTADVFDHDEPSREKDAYITIHASDNGHPQLDDACTIKIVIEDINDNQPVFDKVSYTESVPQDLPSKREVMRISATDIDDGNNSVVHYSLDTNKSDHSYFIIDPDNGVIFLNKTIDKPPGYKFVLNAFVQDSGKQPQQSSINLNILVVESNKKSPSFIEVPEEPIKLKENYADFTKPIATVRAISNIPDETKLQFELVAGQTEQTNKWHTFVLEPESDSAVIKLGSLLDFEKITEYTLTIRIQNNYRLAAETIINIQILDVNDNIPIFSEIRSGSVLENEPPGTPVMQVQAFDADGTSANNQVTYELGDPSDPFAIDSVTGDITTLKMFDREDKAFYNIKIIATDNAESALIPGKHNSGQQIFQIAIADKNDNPPHFTQDTYVAESIAENANINELVTQITAIDTDTASVVSYSIVSGNIYNAFLIKNFTGEVRVNANLDYENISVYNLEVKAYDGIYEDFAKVIINIENLNDNPPVFVANYTRVIEEERLYPGCIVTVEAYDPDIKDRNAPQHIVYALVKKEQAEFLSIDDKGCLRLTKPLDRDPPAGFQKWQILIMAADQGGRVGFESLRSTTEVIIELTDINDNKPFLSNLQPSRCFENEPPGFIANLQSKDYDTPKNGPPFFYVIQNSPDGIDYRRLFLVKDDKLYGLVSFNREQKKQYDVPLAISDSGKPIQTGISYATVIIGDRNDNPMLPGHSSIIVYSYEGRLPDTDIGRVYVNDPDDWDVPNKTFSWVATEENRSPYFDVNYLTGMITLKTGVPEGKYHLEFNVTEDNHPAVEFHWVLATVNVTVKNIPKVAIEKSGSIRFYNVTQEEFITAENDISKHEKLHGRLALIFNNSLDNIEVHTVYPKQIDSIPFLDVLFSVHGSPYYSPDKINSIVIAHQEEIETDLNLRIYMIDINECLDERIKCDDDCENSLSVHDRGHIILTNTTSFIGISAYLDAMCTCSDLTRAQSCLNGGTSLLNRCECPAGYDGPHCERMAIGFKGNGWAMLQGHHRTCSESYISLYLTTNDPNGLIFYAGPQSYNELKPVKDFMAMQLVDGYVELYIDYGNGTIRINNSAVKCDDGKIHHVQVLLMKKSAELLVDDCRKSDCMSIGSPPTDNEDLVNVHGPLLIAGVNFDIKKLGAKLGWKYVPTDKGFAGCISNVTQDNFVFDLGTPLRCHEIVDSCANVAQRAVSLGINNHFIIAILVCVAVLIILLLAVVVHRKRNDTWAEKELDDIRENIIAYEDEGGGEGDAGYDLHVLRQMYEGPQARHPHYMHGPVGVIGATPDISGFLDDKKSVLDRDPDQILDDARHYAYEGDGNTSGSLSSLASCTDDADLKFNYLSTFGPRFRKLADMYGDTDEERAALEESWC